MTLMKIDNIESLLEIHYKTGVDMDKMLSTATNKAIQYRNQYDNGYSPRQEDYDRAIRVMQRYANIHYFKPETIE
jgi:hypothetical protein